MARMQRPKEDFWCTDLKSDLRIVATHTEAGFEPIPDEVVRTRLFVLLDFLHAKGLITEQLAPSVEDIKPDTALWNRHMMEDGYYFLQEYLARWQGRLYKHTTGSKERAFLEKWHEQFKHGANM